MIYDYCSCDGGWGNFESCGADMVGTVNWGGHTVTFRCPRCGSATDTANANISYGDDKNYRTCNKGICRKCGGKSFRA